MNYGNGMQNQNSVPMNTNNGMMNNYGSYFDRAAQFQQYGQNMQMPQPQMFPQMQPQVSTSPQNLVGKAVNDFSEITANDVPMNGTSAIFPKTDGLEIQVRTWGADGKIQTVVYKPVLENNKAEDDRKQQIDINCLNENVKAFREEILGRLDSMEQSLTNVSAKTSKSQTRTKKEGVSDE